MTDSYHFESVAKLEPGEFVINTDESVSACLRYSGGQWTWDKQSWASGYKSMEAFTQNLIAQGYKRRETIVFPSGASVLTSGDKIVGRVEAQSAESLPDCPQCGYGPAYCNCKYLRAPLPHFNQRTEFDAFPDFVVFHEFEPTSPLYDSPTTDSAYPAIAGLLRG